ncbi:MAG: hypothetical protein K0R50_327 [Eubacterium sp.]|nr:hypothetical protein [Eubacterium sp.]
MSLFINSVRAGKTYTSIAALDDKNNDENTQVKQKKKQILSVREGNYYCTYIVDEKGQKILLKRIPADQVKEQKGLGMERETDDVRPCDYNAVKNARTAFECRQQMDMEISHKKNLKEIMNILEDYAGITEDSNKNYD